MTQAFEINSRPIGPGHPTYIIAEMSANHNQDYAQFVAIIEAVKASGADAVKLQTYTADTLTINSDKAHFQIKEGTLWSGKNLYELYGEAYTPWDWQPKLKQEAERLGMDLFSTPFDPTSIEFLEQMDVPAYKVASFEIVDLPLIAAIARKGKPIIMSTGMASLAEIEEAVRTVRANGNSPLALLKCTSAYPAPANEANLRTIPHLAQAFNVISGLSDHTLGIAVPVAAVALGACIIEKHFTLSRELEGPDSAFSLEPQEFTQMVDAIRVAESALGQVNYELTEREKKSIVFRRSLFAVEDIKAGEKFNSKNVRSIRPGDGLPPKYLDTVIGKTATRAIERGTPLSWELIG